MFVFTFFAAPFWCFSQVKLSIPDTEINFENKEIPEALEMQIKKTLSYYPELENTPIDFIFKNKIRKVTMQAQPRVRTLFKGKSKRTYKIKISRYLVLNDTIKAIEEISDDILIGWIAHELGHIMDYSDRSAVQMIGFGVKYITSIPFLKESERRADVHAINHGFAENIIKTKNYILNLEGMPEDYKQRISRLYISPEEVKAIEGEIESSY